MPMVVKLYRVVIASPSDVRTERRAIEEVLKDWNLHHTRELGVALHPAKWETDAAPIQALRPQEAINQQVVEGADLLIGVFWTRLGTPTGKAESGTLEEIQLMKEQGGPVLIYFSKRPIPTDGLDPDEYKRVLVFKRQCREDGLYSEYGSIAEFKRKLFRHLSLTVRKLTSGLVQGAVQLQPSGAKEMSTGHRLDQWRQKLNRSVGGFANWKLVCLPLGDHSTDWTPSKDSLGTAARDTLGHLLEGKENDRPKEDRIEKWSIVREQRAFLVSKAFFDGALVVGEGFQEPGKRLVLSGSSLYRAWYWALRYFGAILSESGYSDLVRVYLEIGNLDHDSIDITFEAYRNPSKPTKDLHWEEVGAAALRNPRALCNVMFRKFALSCGIEPGENYLDTLYTSACLSGSRGDADVSEHPIRDRDKTFLD